MKVIITEATVNDLDEIEKVRKAVWLTTYPNECEGITIEDVLSKFAFKSIEEKERNLNKRKEELLNKNSKHFVAKVDEKIVGFSSVIRGKNYNKLATLYILSDYQRKGIGKQLVEKSIKWLGDDLDIRVKFAKYNKNARFFYKKLGFKDIKKEKVEKLSLPTGKKILKSEMMLLSDMLKE